MVGTAVGVWMGECEATVKAIWIKALYKCNPFTILDLEKGCTVFDIEIWDLYLYHLMLCVCIHGWHISYKITHMHIFFMCSMNKKCGFRLAIFISTLNIYFFRQLYIYIYIYIHTRVYLFTVEDHHKLQSVDERQQRAEQSARPHHRLSVHQSQDVGRDLKLLTTDPLNELHRWPVNHHPGGHTHGPCTSKDTSVKGLYTVYSSSLHTLLLCWTSYLRGNSTSTSIAIVMMRSKRASLYISCPTRVSQHYRRVRRSHHVVRPRVPKHTSH